MSQRSDLVQTNVEVVRGVFDAWSSGDVQRAFEFLDPGIVWDAIADAPDSGTYEGHAGMRRYMEDWLRDFDFEPMEFGEIVGAGDRLVITQSIRGRGKASGAVTEIHYAVAYRLRAGKVIEAKEFRTKQEALEAAGLSEP